ncbi:hypothetical protein CF392_06460 [Tamilnaduibacter salinus]|uniref:Uncharacterized protein n=1 Tax=Tamilnaduibacter salinus TaxID=1484056 RepID=A0A2A2I5C1_9GAMM|nr:hypothetical protein CF392_06460 [Tamilnaduibacter salinus]
MDAEKKRMSLPGGPTHVVQRGHNRNACLLLMMTTAIMPRQKDGTALWGCATKPLPDDFQGALQTWTSATKLQAKGC